MNIKYCDRCKKKMNMNPMAQCQNPLFRIDYVNPMGFPPIDLCEDCSREFVNWVKKGVDNGNDD